MAYVEECENRKDQNVREYFEDNRMQCSRMVAFLTCYILLYFIYFLLVASVLFFKSVLFVLPLVDK